MSPKIKTAVLGWANNDYILPPVSGIKYKLYKVYMSSRNTVAGTSTGHGIKFTNQDGEVMQAACMLLPTVANVNQIDIDLYSITTKSGDGVQMYFAQNIASPDGAANVMVVYDEVMA